MKTIDEMIINYVSKGMTINQAENYVCQEIILNKISKSPMADRVLIKGGVAMFNTTKNLRRSTIDLDFDFIRYDISNKSIELFIELLNKYNSTYIVKIDKIEPLHQDDYQGKRVIVTIRDKTRKIVFKLDIGVYTLLAIEQSSACFYFDDENQIVLKVNPPEQIFAEKLLSLAKHGVLSTRYKDIFDMYYFINEKMLKKDVVRKCLELLLIKPIKGIATIDDVCENVSKVFENDQYNERIRTTKEKWIDIDYMIVFKTIEDYIFSI